MQAVGGAPLVLILRYWVLFTVEDLQHVLVRLFQTQFLGDLVQWQVDFALQVSDQIKAPVEVESVLLADLEQELDHSAFEITRSTTTLKRCRFDLVSQLEQLLVPNHDVDEQVQVSHVVLSAPLWLCYCAIFHSCHLLLALEILFNHALSLEAPVLSILELAVVHECPHYLSDQLELILALLQTSEHLLAPLLTAVTFRVQAEPEENLKTFDLGRISKIVQYLEQ